MVYCWVMKNGLKVCLEAFTKDPYHEAAIFYWKRGWTGINNKLKISLKMACVFASFQIQNGSFVISYVNRNVMVKRYIRCVANCSRALIPLEAASEKAYFNSSVAHSVSLKVCLSSQCTWHWSVAVVWYRPRYLCDGVWPSALLRIRIQSASVASGVRARALFRCSSESNLDFSWVLFAKETLYSNWDE